MDQSFIEERFEEFQEESPACAAGNGKFCLCVDCFVLLGSGESTRAIAPGTRVTGTGASRPFPQPFLSRHLPQDLQLFCPAQPPSPEPKVRRTAILSKASFLFLSFSHPSGKYSGDRSWGAKLDIFATVYFLVCLFTLQQASKQNNQQCPYLPPSFRIAFPIFPRNRPEIRKCRTVRLTTGVNSPPSNWLLPWVKGKMAYDFISSLQMQFPEQFSFLTNVRSLGFAPFLIIVGGVL